MSKSKVSDVQHDTRIPYEWTIHTHKRAHKRTQQYTYIHSMMQHCFLNFLHSHDSHYANIRLATRKALCPGNAAHFCKLTNSYGHPLNLAIQGATWYRRPGNSDSSYIYLHFRLRLLRLLRLKIGVVVALRCVIIRCVLLRCVAIYSLFSLSFSFSFSLCLFVSLSLCLFVVCVCFLFVGDFIRFTRSVSVGSPISPLYVFSLHTI